MIELWSSEILEMRGVVPEDVEDSNTVGEVLWYF